MPLLTPNNPETASRPGKGREAPLWLPWLVLLAVLVAAGVSAGIVQAQAEAVFLSRIVFVVGHSGDDYGYSSGSYGSHTSGNFSQALFDDDLPRRVSKVYEDADGYWYLYYSSGTADEWLSDQDALDDITVTVTYEDGRDTRSFVLGGFINKVLSSNGLKLNPPLPPDSRDWDTRNGDTVEMEFHRHRGTATEATPAAIDDPTAESASFVEFLSDSTPGGAVMAQTLITIITYIGFLLRAPRTDWGVILTAIVLIMTPWVPVLFGYGSTMAGVIVFVNVLAGAYVYKIFFARTET